jgi:hypothetical protein
MRLLRQMALGTAGSLAALAGACQWFTGAHERDLGAAGENAGGASGGSLASGGSDRKIAAVTGGGLGAGFAPSNGELPLEFDVFSDACGKETPKVVYCGEFLGGGVVCTSAAGCCTEHAYGDSPICAGNAAQTCEQALYLSQLFCDDRADCPSGTVCCIDYKRSECKPVCDPPDVQMCTTCRECGSGKNCVDQRCTTGAAAP